MPQSNAAVWAYGVPVARVIGAALGWPVLLFGLWIGQGCVDDPCEIGRRAEWRGLLVLAALGVIAMVVVSVRYRLLRASLWLVSGVPVAVTRWGEPPQAEGPAIITEAPGIFAVSLFLLTWSYPVMLVLTLCLDSWSIWRDRNVRRNSSSLGI